MNVSIKFLNPRHVDCGEAGGAAAAMQAVGCFRLAKQRDGDCKERKAAEGPIFVVGSVNSGSIVIGGGGKSSRCRHF